jgi:DNA (cytosine-5)-methyltransferase 1
MIYGSVCSGIEAATVAWHPLGFRPAFFSEIEKFPCSALSHHYPSVPNHGDMTKFEEWPAHAIDLLVGGTPCQSFSVAGLRKGLDDPRGNLMLTYLAIARRYKPRWLVWENVPGVLSSNGGRDFGTFIRGLEECGYHAAWRVLDAQYCRVDGFTRAVPQRRRRVFVVGYLGDWRRAAAVLLEREGMRWDTAPSRQAGERPSTTISARPEGSGRLDLDGGLIADICGTINSSGGNAYPGQTLQDATAGQLIVSTGNVAHCLNAGGMGRQDYETETMIATAPAIAFAHQAGGNVTASGACSVELSPTLQRMQTMAVQREWAVRRLTPTECERLQGFPDNYTNVPHRGKPAADGPRYKALGNSMAVNVMRWIGQRIAAVEDMAKEIAA